MKIRSTKSDVLRISFLLFLVLVVILILLLILILPSAQSIGVCHWRTVAGYILSSVIITSSSTSLSFFLSFFLFHIQAHVIYWIGNHVQLERRLLLV